ncbi:hypothetical protein [Atopobium sp. oral taxon 810]|uniref:hypothetical protein n=1 Tax=Atopobium sp. oral taxon 810 TaxID=712158 RepID=UPI00039698D4|nr:hypothetical protein [Atopobium sp. oral taxon 810]ERI04972.1 LPXTG-motif protein cell wall anchor domain protein [Atopobium sp. oral taxon 810 str. F0209]
MNVKSGTLAKAAVAAALSCAIASPFVAVNAYAAEDAPTNNNDATVAAAPAAPAEEATETVAATTPETTAAPEAEVTPATEETPEAEATPATETPAPAEATSTPAAPTAVNRSAAHPSPTLADQVKEMMQAAGIDVDKYSNLYGDILINNDSTTKTAYKVKAGEVVAVSGTLNVSNVWALMQEIEKAYGSVPIGFFLGNESKVNFAFTITLTLPEGMDFEKDTDGKVDITYDNFGDAETGIWDTTASAEGKTLTVIASIKEDMEYGDLRNFVKKIAEDTKNGVMSITVNKVKVSDNAQPGKIVVKGNVNGKMGLGKETLFEWGSAQDPNGIDAEGPNDGSIQATLEVEKKADPKPETKPQPKPAPAPKAAPKHIAPAKAVKKSSALPQTSDTATALPAAVLAIAGGLLAAAATVLRKRNEN